jgi:hypothetical protein
MNYAFHFDTDEAEYCAGTSFPGMTFCFSKTVASLCKFANWSAPIDVRVGHLATDLMSYIELDLTKQVGISWFDHGQFSDILQKWQRSTEDHWFHVGKCARFDLYSLGRLCAVHLSNLSPTIAECVACDLAVLPYYHSTYEIDFSNRAHEAVYRRWLQPKYSLVSRTCANIMLEFGSDEIPDVVGEEVLRRAGFISIQYESYSPLDPMERGLGFARHSR